MNVSEKEFKELLYSYKKFTVLGLSPSDEKPSHYVPLYMKQQGWDIVGVYPKVHNTNGFQIFKTLAEVPKDYRKFINVFRASNKIPQLIDEIIDLEGVEVIWLQLGIEHPDAEKKAEEAGIKVISNRCLIIEHKAITKNQF